MKQGFAFNDLLTNLERIAAHCSNIAVAMIELEAADFDTHEYLKSVRELRMTLTWHTLMSMKENMTSMVTGRKRQKHRNRDQ